KGKVQIEYGLLTDPQGRPVAVRVLEGNTADPAAFTQIAGVVHGEFGLRKTVMVGDRGMITTARIEALKELDGKYGWITALRSPQIRKLMADDGPLQLSLFDEQDLAEITSPDFPGERLVACRNPALAEERARKREALLTATEKLLAPIAARVTAGRLAGADKIGTAAGKVIGKYKMAKHFDVTITDTSLAIERRQDQIAEEALLDGIYVTRPPVPAETLDTAGAVTAYKSLKHVERDFRHIKSDDLDLRPVFHRLEKRVKGHVLICMLAAYLTWHLRQAWAPLTYTDDDPPVQANPVTPARRSASADAKASRQHDQAGRPYRSFGGLLAHLGTLTRNRVLFAGAPAAVPVLTEPTSQQREAFDLIGAPIPLILRKLPGQPPPESVKPQLIAPLGRQTTRNFGLAERDRNRGSPSGVVNSGAYQLKGMFTVRASAITGRRMLAVCCLTPIALLAAACGSSGTTAAPARTVTVTLTPSSSPRPAPPASSGPLQCLTTDLRLTVGAANGAAGTIYYPLDFTYASSSTCT